ncbi:unnamed protein product [Nippostrongylus brasiliensis]|uniref:Uncharacterized protein n=1 Tax=Nippostrongylus brasiliensis TaxID=27835 RepID=A0A0N4YLN6_NIPBR|nr:unnamed protein product [Nippostrongylus brasiliensis]
MGRRPAGLACGVRLQRFQWTMSRRRRVNPTGRRSSCLSGPFDQDACRSSSPFSSKDCSQWNDDEELYSVRAQGHFAVEMVSSSTAVD